MLLLKYCHVSPYMGDSLSHPVMTSAKIYIILTQYLQMCVGMYAVWLCNIIFIDLDVVDG